MVQIAGKYKRTKVENYDKFLDKIGAGFMIKISLLYWLHVPSQGPSQSDSCKLSSVVVGRHRASCCQATKSAGAN